MIKTYLKTLWRMFEKHVTRLLSLIFMVLVSVGFVSGIGSSTDKINYSMTDYYKAQTVSDFIIKSKAENGFTDEDTERIKKLFDGATVNTGNSLDIKVGEKRSVRYYFLDFDEWTVNVPDVMEGGVDDPNLRIYAERADNVIKGTSVGDKITLDFKDILVKLSEQNGTELDANTLSLLSRLTPVEVTVGGIVQSPLTFANDGEPSYNNDVENMPDTTTGTEDMDCLENVFYISRTLIPTLKSVVPQLPDAMDRPFIGIGDIYVALEDRGQFSAFGWRYKNVIEKGEAEIAAALGDVEVITLYDNYSFKSLKSYSDKVAGIGYILMVVFLLVTALVVLSTMTRLLEEERSQIACLRTLGYSSTDIISKYLLFALIATGIGGAGAYFVGLGLAHLIYYVFNYSFYMPPVSAHVAVVFYIISFTLIVAATLVATVISGYKLTGERPATLLRPKPPRAGKKVILERIGVIWNRLSFKYKSTMRNVLRYKSRFIMTVFSVAVSTALVMAGLGLLDLCLF